MAKLDQLFGGSLAGNPHQWRLYHPVKLGYSMGYALVMWLLVFGTLGFFQAAFPAESAAWRYVADSSYWIYLIHLPLVAGLQVWMASWPWPGAIKFLVLNAIAFTILFASYHYLVRSTFIGRILNGRACSVARWPFTKRRRTPTVPHPAVVSDSLGAPIGERKN